MKGGKFVVVAMFAIMVFSSYSLNFIENSQESNKPTLPERIISTDQFNFRNYPGEIPKSTSIESRKNSPSDMNDVNLGVSQLRTLAIPLKDDFSITTFADTGPVDFNDTLVISGTLQGPAIGGGTEPWASETVELFIDQTMTDVVNQNVVADQTTITDAVDGTFSFNVNFISTDIGAHTYIVYFYGSGFAREAGPVLDLNPIPFAVLDPTDITFSSNLQTVGPSTPYTVTVTITPLSGNNIDSLQVQFDEEYNPNSASEFHGLVNVVGGIASYTDTYGPSQNDLFPITAVITNTVSQPFLRFTQPGTINLNITVATSFVFSGKIDGANIIPSSRYYRNNQSLSFNGTLIDEGSLPPGSLIGRSYTISIDGGGKVNQLVDSNVTDANGQFFFNYTLSKGNFSDVTDDLIVITAEITNTTGLAIGTPTVQISFMLIENLALDFNLTVSDSNAQLFYFPGSGMKVNVSGILFDGDGLPAANVPIKLRVNDKQNAGDAWNASIAEINNIPTDNTDSNGYFEILWTITTFTTQTSRLTFNLSIFDAALPNYWNETVDITKELGSINYFQSLIIVYEKNLGGGLVSLSGVSIPVFNETFADYLTNGEFYRVNVTDQFGRIPDNSNSTTAADDIFVQFQFSGINTKTFAVNSTNNGIIIATFNALNSTDLQSLLNTQGTSFTYSITVGGNLTVAPSPQSETYDLYGPDDQNPIIQPGFSLNGENSGLPDNLTITVTLDFSTPLLFKQDNVRNVTFYYRVTTTAFTSYDANNFIGIAWIPLLMVNSTNTIYGSSVPFAGHGYWLQWYVIVYDLAGQGLDENGNTKAFNDYPNYEQTLTRTVFASITGNTIDAVNPEFAQFGDFDIVTPDLETSVSVNAVDVNDLQNANNVTAGEDIDIILELIVDLGGYDNVTINWWYSQYDITTGEFLFNSTVTSALMDYQGLQNGLEVFNYTIVTGMDWWGRTIDYNFTIFDNNGNTAQTQSISTVSLNNPAIATMAVQDETVPNIIRTLINNTRGTPSPTTFSGWNNETITLSYNITEIAPGVGLWNVSYIIYYYNNDQSLNLTLTDLTEMFLLLNGIDQGTSLAINGSATYVATFEIDLTGLINGTFISWTIFFSDAAGNAGLQNEQTEVRTDPDTITELQIDVDNPPIIIVTSTTIITDSEGNEQTIIITSTLGESSLLVEATEEESSNALYIIFGFALLVGLLSLWYQRHNIREMFARRARAKRVQGTLKELIDEIKRLGTEGKYRRAILLTWEALERVSREILQSPRHFNQTAREFSSYISTITIVDRETLLTLSSSYEKAKYGKENPNHDDWDDAVKALEITVQTIIESGARRQIIDDDDWDD